MYGCTVEPVYGGFTLRQPLSIMVTTAGLSCALILYKMTCLEQPPAKNVMSGHHGQVSLYYHCGSGVTKKAYSSIQE